MSHQPSNYPSMHTPSYPAVNPHRSTGDSGYHTITSFAIPPQAQYYQAGSQSQHQSVPDGQYFNINPQTAIYEIKYYISSSCVDQLEKCIVDFERNFLIDLTHLSTEKPYLFQLVQSTPDVLFLFGDLALHQVAEEMLAYQESLTNPAELELPTVKNVLRARHKFAQDMRLFAHNAPQSAKISMRSLSPFFVDKLISIEGLLTSKSAVIPDASSVVFICKKCAAICQAPAYKQTVAVPTACGSCGCHEILAEYDASTFSSKLTLKIQEHPDSTRSGETPVNIRCTALQQQTEKVEPGDRVVVTCVYRVYPERLRDTQSLVRSVFTPFLDVVWVDVVRKGEADLETRMQSEMDAFRQQKELPDDIKVLIPRSDDKNDPALLKLIQSVAPSVYGDDYQQIKLALLLQAVQGSDSAIGRKNVHVLLIGDPGQAKSYLVKFMSSITPRSVYTTGKNSSQAGLTAAVVRENGDVHLEAGALVLASGGLCALDEFDKLDDTVRGVLHECMEQQTVSVAKAGVVCTLKAETAVLAAANPVDSKYNVKKTVIQNLNLEPSLISRFDLIFLLLDKNEPESDRKLAHHLMSLYFDPEQSSSSLTYYQLKRYIALCRELNPVLNEYAETTLERLYINLRNGAGRGRVAATPRQLLGMMRLAYARAKLRFSLEVTAVDVECAYAMVMDALKMSATDENGRINLQMLNVNEVIDLGRIENLSKLVLEKLNEKGEITVKEIAETTGADIQLLKQAMQLLEDQGQALLRRDVLFINK